jgi:glycosyltransferase involved in cell wall biosynthesis
MISLIIPALNEEGAVRPTIENARRVLEAITPEFEILLVDDGSTDDTFEIATAAGATVLRHPQNMGYGRSLKTGIQAAQYELILMTDADGTYPIEHVPRMLEQVNKGFDMVVGARVGSEFRGGAVKSLLRFVLKTLVEFASGREIPDINSGFRMFKRSIALPHLTRICDTFSFTTSLTLAFMMTGRFVTYVPIPYLPRVGKSKVRLLRDSIRTYMYIIQAILYYNPIKIFAVLAVVTFLLSLFSLALGLIFHITIGFGLGGGGLLTVLIIFSMGLLADLLKRIMDK